MTPFPVAKNVPLTFKAASSWSTPGVTALGPSSYVNALVLVSAHCKRTGAEAAESIFKAVVHAGTPLGTAKAGGYCWAATSDEAMRLSKKSILYNKAATNLVERRKLRLFVWNVDARLQSVPLRPWRRA